MLCKWKNKYAKNVESPSNEDKYRSAYKQLNKAAKRIGDGLDIAAVITKSGIRGHALMPDKYNRCHDEEYHRVRGFIPDSVLERLFVRSRHKISSFQSCKHQIGMM